MNQKQLILVSAFILVACGPPKRLELSLEALERNQVVLKRKQEETARKMEDLSNSLMVLQDRLETIKVAADRQPVPPPPVPRSKSKKVPKGKPRPPEEDPTEESIFGFGQGGGKHLPALAFTNRDLDASEPKPKGKEAVKPEEEKPVSGGAENPEAARAYNDAFKKFEDGSYPEAVRLLDEFAAKYPTHVYSDNAVYWIGESYFRNRDFGKAAEQFERVGKEFPGGNKVPDALLRAASCYLRLNKPGEARRAFEKIIATYPQSVAAQKARASLTEISDAGSEPRRM